MEGREGPEWCPGTPWLCPVGLPEPYSPPSWESWGGAMPCECHSPCLECAWCLSPHRCRQRRVVWYFGPRCTSWPEDGGKPCATGFCQKVHGHVELWPTLIELAISEAIFLQTTGFPSSISIAVTSLTEATEPGPADATRQRR